MKDSIGYLNSLTLIDGRPVKTSRRKAFVIGFTSAVHSVLGIARYVFDKHSHTKYLLPYKLGQDHIEMLFSKIRSKGGYNNNPDVMTFKSALRALLVKSDITPSSNANCIELENGASGSLLLQSLAKRKKKVILDEPEDVEDDFEDEAFTFQVQLPKTATDITEYISKYPNNL